MLPILLWAAVALLLGSWASCTRLVAAALAATTALVFLPGHWYLAVFALGAAPSQTLAVLRVLARPCSLRRLFLAGGIVGAHAWLRAATDVSVPVVGAVDAMLARALSDPADFFVEPFFDAFYDGLDAIDFSAGLAQDEHELQGLWQSLSDGVHALASLSVFVECAAAYAHATLATILDTVIFFILTGAVLAAVYHVLAWLAHGAGAAGQPNRDPNGELARANERLAARIQAQQQRLLELDAEAAALHTRVEQLLRGIWFHVLCPGLRHHLDAVEADRVPRTVPARTPMPTHNVLFRLRHALAVRPGLNMPRVTDMHAWDPHATHAALRALRAQDSTTARALAAETERLRGQAAYLATTEHAIRRDAATWHRNGTALLGPRARGRARTWTRADAESALAAYDDYRALKAAGPAAHWLESFQQYEVHKAAQRLRMAPLDPSWVHAPPVLSPLLVSPLPPPPPPADTLFRFSTSMETRLAKMHKELRSSLQKSAQNAPCSPLAAFSPARRSVSTKHGARADTDPAEQTWWWQNHLHLDRIIADDKTATSPSDASPGSPGLPAVPVLSLPRPPSRIKPASASTALSIVRQGKQAAPLAPAPPKPAPHKPAPLVLSAVVSLCVPPAEYSATLELRQKQAGRLPWNLHLAMLSPSHSEPSPSSSASPFSPFSPSSPTGILAPTPVVDETAAATAAALAGMHLGRQSPLTVPMVAVEVESVGSTEPKTEPKFGSNDQAPVDQTQPEESQTEHPPEKKTEKMQPEVKEPERFLSDPILTGQVYAEDVHDDGTDYDFDVQPGDAPDAPASVLSAADRLLLEMEEEDAGSTKSISAASEPEEYVHDEAQAGEHMAELPLFDCSMDALTVDALTVDLSEANVKGYTDDDFYDADLDSEVENAHEDAPKSSVKNSPKSSLKNSHKSDSEDDFYDENLDGDEFENVPIPKFTAPRQTFPAPIATEQTALEQTLPDQYMTGQTPVDQFATQHAPSLSAALNQHRESVSNKLRQQMFAQTAEQQRIEHQQLEQQYHQYSQLVQASAPKTHPFNTQMSSVVHDDLDAAAALGSLSLQDVQYTQPDTVMTQSPMDASFVCQKAQTQTPVDTAMTEPPAVPNLLATESAQPPPLIDPSLDAAAELFAATLPIVDVPLSPSLQSRILAFEEQKNWDGKGDDGDDDFDISTSVVGSASQSPVLTDTVEQQTPALTDATDTRNQQTRQTASAEEDDSTASEDDFDRYVAEAFAEVDRQDAERAETNRSLQHALARQAAHLKLQAAVRAPRRRITVPVAQPVRFGSASTSFGFAFCPLAAPAARSPSAAPAARPSSTAPASRPSAAPAARPPTAPSAPASRSPVAPSTNPPLQTPIVRAAPAAPDVPTPAKHHTPAPFNFATAPPIYIPPFPFPLPATPPPPEDADENGQKN